LIGPLGSPKRYGDTRLVQHPPHGNIHHVFSVSFLRQIIQLMNRIQVLREARRLEFRIGPAEIVAGEFCVRLHRPGQEPPAERPVSESAQILFAHVGQHVAINLPLKEVIRRLDGVQLRDRHELVHLLR